MKGIAGLVGGAVVLWIVYEFASVFLPQARDNAPGGYGDVLMNNWFGVGLDTVLPLAFLGLFFFGMVAQGILRSG